MKRSKPATSVGSKRATSARIASILADALKTAPIVETDLIERVDAAQVDVVGHAAAAQRPEFFEQVGRGDDGGTGVEGEAVLVVGVGAASRGIEAFEYGDAVAACAQAYGGGEAAEAGADDDGVRTWCS